MIPVKSKMLVFQDAKNTRNFCVQARRKLAMLMDAKPIPRLFFGKELPRQLERVIHHARREVTEEGQPKHEILKNYYRAIIDQFECTTDGIYWLL